MIAGILVTSIGNFGQKNFYHAQEIGLAKAMGVHYEKVIVYKAIDESKASKPEHRKITKNVEIREIPVRSWGINGRWDCRFMEPYLDILVYFSDTQLALPGVYQWCSKHNVRLVPYIGVFNSHSPSFLRRAVMAVLSKKKSGYL